MIDLSAGQDIARVTGSVVKRQYPSENQARQMLVVVMYQTE